MMLVLLWYYLRFLLCLSCRLNLIWLGFNCFGICCYLLVCFLFWVMGIAYYVLRWCLSVCFDIVCLRVRLFCLLLC